MSSSNSYFIGLMSGTSMDGVDAVLANFEGTFCRIIECAFVSFPDDLKQTLLQLNASGTDEIERSHLSGNHLARLYSNCIAELLARAGVPTNTIGAIGCHGQTIRHRPELGFTVQIGNAALLTELTGITVIANFRSRDIAAGGQGAPLVPAFHQAVFGNAQTHRVIVNIGGISNLSDLLPAGTGGGFDCGPGNLLMDGWALRHIGQPYDKDGAWAASGKILPDLLSALLTHPFFTAPPPKSTGRDDFHMAWLERHVAPQHTPVDVQATLLELTAMSISDALAKHCAAATEVYLCGGGAYNGALVRRLSQLLHPRKLALTDALGIPANIVEAAAFAWLARQTLLGLPGNLPAATGASGPRILGAIYPA
jgi:anhydro-N-acetylmuramic acid kinase